MTSRGVSRGLCAQPRGQNARHPHGLLAPDVAAQDRRRQTRFLVATEWPPHRDSQLGGTTRPAVTPGRPETCSPLGSFWNSRRDSKGTKTAETHKNRKREPRLGEMAPDSRKAADSWGASRAGKAETQSVWGPGQADREPGEARAVGVSGELRTGRPRGARLGLCPQQSPLASRAARHGEQPGSPRGL